MLRKTLCCILCCIAILCLTATSVLASGAEIEPDQTGSIRYDFSGFEPAIQSGSLELRMVASFDFASKTAQMCEGYEAFLDDPNELFGEKKYAEELLAYALAHALPAQELTVGADGTVCASELPQGIYLISQSVPFEGYFCIVPTLISVPMKQNQTWVLDVTAAPKLEPIPEETTPTVPTEETEPTTPSETKPPDEEIPKTGQINWPVPLLLVGGSFLVLLGVCLRKEKNHET